MGQTGMIMKHNKESETDPHEFRQQVYNKLDHEERWRKGNLLIKNSALSVGYP